MNPIPENLRKQSVADVYDDFEFLTYLAGDLSQKIARNKKKILHVGNRNHPSSSSQTLTLIDFIGSELNKGIKRLHETRSHWEKSQHTIQDLGHATHETGMVFETIRALSHAFGAAITASDWQSPSYDASGYMQSGRQTGAITATQNDYKRDQHEDAYRYEQAFLKEYIDAPLTYQIHIHATHSGMAAFSTILGFLLGEGHIKTSVLIGTNVYFEVKQMLKAILKEKIHEVDETDVKKIAKALEKYQPDAVFFDGISNSDTMAVCGINSVISLIERTVKKETYIVIDNTTTSVFVQPFKRFEKPGAKTRLICFESLNKFHQFGMDSVFGGIIISRGGDTINLFNYRRSMGTNISDTASLILPTPNRLLLTNRIRRIERNTMALAQTLSQTLTEYPDNPIDHIVYPGLSTHPQHAITTDFSGPFITFAFKPEKNMIPILKKTVQHIMNQAKKDGVPLVAGTSFGLSTTRIYQTATNTTETVPFLRISPGTESAYAFRRLTETITKTVISMT
jgi:cystathionine beta-lyase/cystathionine gamma-synthase